MTDLSPVDLESTLIIILSPAWFSFVLVWAGWAAVCDWARSSGEPHV